MMIIAEAVGLSQNTARHDEANSVELILRFGAGLCFVGHGVFGLMRKAAWLPYFELAGIGPEVARLLMPVVGTVDIAIGIAVMVTPRIALLSHMVIWAVWTAALRPLAGEPVWELLERAGNYGVPLALIILAGGPRGAAGWFDNTAAPSARPSTGAARGSAIVLRASTGLLLAGHGSLALLGKPLLAEHAAVLGLTPAVLSLAGVFELCLAGAICVTSAPLLLGFIVAWKIGTELLYPISGDYVWEFIERAGSYAAPLALLFLAHRLTDRSAPVDTARTTSVTNLVASRTMIGG
jgi:uncharacterized membrane protein YphA (DoxX/SURF4 family)